MSVRTTKPALCRSTIYTLSVFASILLSVYGSALPVSAPSMNGPIIAPKTVATTQSNVIASTDVAPQVSIAPTIPIPYSVPYSFPVPVASGYPYPVPSSAAFSKRWGGGDCGGGGDGCNQCGNRRCDCDDCHDSDDCDDCHHDGDDC